MHQAARMKHDAIAPVSKTCTVSCLLMSETQSKSDCRVMLLHVSSWMYIDIKMWLLERRCSTVPACSQRGQEGWVQVKQEGGWVFGGRGSMIVHLSECALYITVPRSGTGAEIVPTQTCASVKLC